MAPLPLPALELFAAHHGVATRHQLMELGVTKHDIRTLRKAGNLETVLHGVYRTPAAPYDELSKCAAVSARYPDSAIAGVTAGRIWGFRRLPSDRRIHLVTPPASQHTRRKWIVPYRTSAIHPDDIIERDDGIRVTSRARTAFDLSRVLSGLDLLSVIEQAMHDGRITDDTMRRVAVDWISPQRPWVLAFLACLDRRLDGGPSESHPEVLVGDALRRRGVHGLVRQLPIDLPEYGAARFDLAEPALRWAIEIDGFPTHRETAGRALDRSRDAAAQSIGWSTSRVTHEEFGTRLPATVERLMAERTAVAEAKRSHHTPRR